MAYVRDEGWLQLLAVQLVPVERREPIVGAYIFKALESGFASQPFRDIPFEEATEKLNSEFAALRLSILGKP